MVHHGSSLGWVLLATACDCGAANMRPSPPAAASSAPSPSEKSAPAAAPAPSSGSLPAVTTEDGFAIPPNVAAALAGRDRDGKDRARDADEHSAALLAFCEVQTGARVAEIFAARGYTTELLARAVGPAGRVYGQNTKQLLEMYFEGDWSERLAKPVNANVVRVDREYDDPLPPEATRLDVVISNLFEFQGREVDGHKMHKAIFAALKSGGVYCVVDNSVRYDRGDANANAASLHRLGVDVLREDVEKSGFRLEDGGKGDWFAVRFVKP